MQTLKPLPKKKEKTNTTKTSKTSKITTKKNKKIDKLSKALHMALDLNQKKPVVAGNGESGSRAVVARTQHTNAASAAEHPENYIKHILNPELIEKVVKHVPLHNLLDFMVMSKTINKLVREVLPNFIKTRFMPGQIRNRLALAAARDDITLNPNTLYRMPLDQFLIEVRPAFIKTDLSSIKDPWSSIKGHYIEKFRQLINRSEDNDAKKLYNFKRIALIYPNYNQEDLIMYTRIIDFNKPPFNIEYPDTFDFYGMEFDDFIENVKPFIVEKFSDADKRAFTNELDNQIERLHGHWHAQAQTDSQEEARTNEENNVKKFQKMKVSIWHPLFTNAEIEEHLAFNDETYEIPYSKCRLCNPPRNQQNYYEDY